MRGLFKPKAKTLANPASPCLPWTIYIEEQYQGKFGDNEQSGKSMRAEEMATKSGENHRVLRFLKSLDSGGQSFRSSDAGWFPSQTYDPMSIR